MWYTVSIPFKRESTFRPTAPIWQALTLVFPFPNETSIDSHDAFDN